MNVLLVAHILEYLRPDCDSDFSQVCFSEQEHLSAGLSNSSAYAEWEFILDDALMVW